MWSKPAQPQSTSPAATPLRVHVGVSSSLGMASSVDDWTVLGSDEASTLGRHIEALEAKLAALNAGMGSDADDETDRQEGEEI